VRLPHGFETISVWQSHVQQHHVYTAFPQMNHGFAHAREVRQFETARLLRAEHLPHQTGISRVILNQKNVEWLFLHERGSRGSLTTDSQKLSILFTTVRNPSRSTGLVMKQFAWS